MNKNGAEVRCSLILLLKYPLMPLQRKKATCARCKLLMYPGGAASKERNHKKGYCSDGVKSKATKDAADDIPPFPQPHGIFEDGAKFHGVQFLKAVSTYYESFIVQGLPASSGEAEDAAFAQMLAARMKRVSPGLTLFQLYKHTTCSLDTPHELIMTHPTFGPCLRIDSLSDTTT